MGSGGPLILIAIGTSEPSVWTKGIVCCKFMLPWSFFVIAGIEFSSWPCLGDVKGSTSYDFISLNKQWIILVLQVCDVGEIEN